MTCYFTSVYSYYYYLVYANNSAYDFLGLGFLGLGFFFDAFGFGLGLGFGLGFYRCIVFYVNNKIGVLIAMVSESGFNRLKAI